MRALCLALVLCLAWTSSVLADTFGGFSAVERSYLVNQDRVCGLLPVTDGVATGPARCQRAAADRLAQLAFQPGTVQRGAKAELIAKASGRALSIANPGGTELVRWEALDPIGKVVEVFSQREERVAVTYQVRRGGRDVIDVIAFELARSPAGKPGAEPAPTGPGTTPTGPGTTPTGPAPATDPPAVVTSPALDQALTAARKAKGKAALAAWQRVLEVEPGHAEALFRRAAALAAKDRAGALAALDRLASSTQPDAIEYQVAARFDGAFAGLRADRAFRKAVGLDRKPEHPYDKAMGFGGVWEQAGTSCDAPTVALTLTREKKFRLQVRTVCEGQVSQSKFAGTWRLEGAGLALILPNRDAAADQIHCRFEAAGDEEALACPLDEDLRIFVLPARR